MSFEIDSRHRLIGEVKHLSDAPDARVIRPRAVVIHYGVTHDLDSLIAAQRARGYWAHCSVSERKVIQTLPFDRLGWHAGPSVLRGEKSVSTFSVGIEINNPGPLVVSESGSLKTVYGKTWPQSDSIEATHPGGLAPKNWKHWAKYSDSTLDTVKSICEALMKRYGIKIIVGHDEIAPGRKFDPGPAFPMQKFRSELGAEGP